MFMQPKSIYLRIHKQRHKSLVPYSIKREKVMQNQKYVRQSSGAKAIAIDTRAELVKMRLLQLTAVILTAALAGGLRLIFIH